MDGLILFIVGFFSWSFVEYAIHGWMSHTYATFARRLHAVHHRDPHAVFAVGTWPFIAVVWLAGVYIWRWSDGVLFFSGMICGFTSYEMLHYRLHFAHSLTSFEEGLRRRHLIHHYVNSSMCLGVTSALWDRVFGTEPTPAQIEQLTAATRHIAPLEGKSNLHMIGQVMLHGWRRVEG
jgi:sterol desaturase/sphingolipid hydroxylase (fatty acid hydroxylase superfamily)